MLPSLRATNLTKAHTRRDHITSIKISAASRIPYLILILVILLFVRPEGDVGVLREAAVARLATSAALPQGFGQSGAGGTRVLGLLGLHSFVSDAALFAHEAVYSQQGRTLLYILRML